jgi:aldehyde:ferredoxin oxidoreductase
MYGYMGSLLRINLSRESVSFGDLDEGMAEKFIGGSGLATKILYDELERGIDPLSRDNKLIFATGPVTGATLFSGRYTVVSKSPLTGIYGQATSGGYFGAELKFSGVDTMIIEGKAENPVYIRIENGEVEIRDAKDIWGMDTVETEESLRELEGDVKVACIGPAGERLVKFASIMNDNGNAAGRTGMGCVMGSKNLKAITVKGEKEAEIAKEDELTRIAKEMRGVAKRNLVIRDLAESGTDGIAITLHLIGGLPTRYYREGTFEGAVNIDGHTMTRKILKKRATCYNCPIACKRVIELKSGPYSGLFGRGPEYETCCAFGSLCLNDDLELIAKANDICNRLGMDTISTGNIIAFCMECYERGLLSEEDMGVKLEWGSHEMLQLIEKIGMREGIGNLLAEGVRAISKKIGAEEIAMQSKGLETAMFDPRALKGMGLVFSTSTRGACHLMGITQAVEMGVVPYYSSLDLPRRFGRRVESGKGKLVKTLQDWKVFMDSMVVCLHPFTRISRGVEDCADIYSAVTGIDFDVRKMLKSGERIYNLQRLFNIREGISKRDDTIPVRFIEESHSKGPNKGEKVNLDRMLEEYYDERDWKEGIPTRGKLDELELIE